MQTVTAPFRFTAQWAMFPLLAAMAVLVGGSLGGFEIWLLTHPADNREWISQVVQSPLLLIIVITLLGLITNSWTIATLSGALVMISNYTARELAEARWESGHYVTVQDVIIGCSTALVVGGGLGVAACVWHHEDGLLQAIGASGLGGALLWAGWRDLTIADWDRDAGQIVAWLALVLAAVVVLRCLQPGFVLLAAAGCLAVAALASVAYGGEHVQLQSLYYDLLRVYRDVESRLREAIRG